MPFGKVTLKGWDLQESRETECQAPPKVEETYELIQLRESIRGQSGSHKSEYKENNWKSDQFSKTKGRLMWKFRMPGSPKHKRNPKPTHTNSVLQASVRVHRNEWGQSKKHEKTSQILHLSCFPDPSWYAAKAIWE